jgi:DNA-binding MarR family transcriptional regulator
MEELNFVHWIAATRKALYRAFEAHAEAFDLTTAQFQVLKRLWQGDGIPTSVLTKDICSDGGTVTGLLDRLEAKGLVSRERNPEDRREVRIGLTERGRELEAPLMKIVNAVNERAIRGLDPEERRRLIAVMKKIGDNLENA